jgi:cytochrome c
MKAHGGTWDPATMNEFLTNPKAYVQGTKMSFAGLPNVQDRANVIAYLKSLEG